MLLLLVLTALSFFILLGAFLIVSAVRARSAARAFANATQAAAVDGIQARTLLDEALLIALRGSKDPAVRTRITESILGDKYGTAGSGTGSITLAYNAANPLLTATATGLTLGPPHGRVLTIVPNPALGGPVSFRTVGGSGGTVFLANTPGRPGFPPAVLSTTSTTYTAVVNGREFAFTGTGTATTGTTAAEPWDAYDDSNPWLAQPVLSDGQVADFLRLSFSGTALPATVDNDNDGIADGVWLEGVLPSRPSPSGTFSYKVSYLVLDLDGRLNINTCGAVDASGTSAIRRGMGYGPADLVPTAVINPAPAAFQSAAGTGTNSLWPDRFLGANAVTIVAGTASPPQRRPPPGVAVVGRYGRNGASGRTGDDISSLQQSIVTGTHVTGTVGYPTALYGLTVAGANAFADLQGSAEVTMQAPSGSDVMPTMRVTVTGSANNDGVDDPYEMRLDALAPRPTAAVSDATTANDDNPFTVADMERILRAADADATSLPQRLPAALGGIAQQSRMRITTDSWDTPALTGIAVAQIQNFLTTGPALIYPWSGTNAASPDVAAGLRFNLNRPLYSGTLMTLYSGRNMTLETAERQEYCKGLYTLIRALAHPSDYPTAQQAAQWAANVVDFRDDDSTMTRFVYDTNPADGWTMDMSGTGAGTATVFGIERPDLLIAETAGWWQASSGTGQLFVTLHRPAWRVQHVRPSGTTPRETLAPELGGNNQLFLSSTVAGNMPATAGDNPVWQLRFDDKVVQFQAVPGGTPQVKTQHVLESGTVTTRTVTVFASGTAAVPIGAGGDVCVHPPNPSPQRFTVSPSLTAHEVAGGFAPAASGTARISLERLADPSRGNGADNPYIVVDTAPVVVINVPPTPPEPPAEFFTKRRRPGPTDPFGARRELAAFWNAGDSLKLAPMAEAWVSGTSEMTGYQYLGSGANPVPWLHWPNRPFVSHAELALVPSMDPGRFLQAYAPLRPRRVPFIVNSGTAMQALPAQVGDVAVRTDVNKSFILSGTAANNLDHWDEFFGSLAVDATPITTATSGATATSGTIPFGQLLLDAVHVPSRFAGTSLTLSGTHPAVQTALQTCGLDWLRAGHMSTWREPGKVNVNTIVSDSPASPSPSDAAVWSTLISGTELQLVNGLTTRNVTFNPFQNGSGASSSAQLLSLSPLSGTNAPPMAIEATSSLGMRDKNPFFAYATAIRLANTATIRSHVFAVWITLETTDSGDGSRTCHRLFAVVDRSIPVGFREGENLNVRDTIRLRRFLE
jgi:hypothetical protein